MPVRFVPPAAVIALAGAVLGVAPAPGQQPQMYKDLFSGRHPVFVRGDSNVPFDEKAHTISDAHCKSNKTSEHIRIEANPPAGATEAEFVHYYYPTPPAPVSDRLAAGLFVKAYRPGIQVKARVVFPKERDPKNPDAPLTTLVAGDTYDRPHTWQPLGFGSLVEAVRKHLPVLHALVGRAVDPSDAYVDRIVLNVFAGPGATDVWVDDLEVGPVRPDAAPPAAKAPGVPAGLAGGKPAANARKVESADGQILVEHDDGQLRPFFMLAVRHTGVPLHDLRKAQFNTVWFPGETPAETVEEAVRHGFWVVPTLPLPAGEWEDGKPKPADRLALARDADRVAGHVRKFSAGDAVLMWDLGGGRTAEDLPRVERVAEFLRAYDPKRPRAADLWDGYGAYSNYVTAVGAHRWPLFTGLELGLYKDWLLQRRALTARGKMTWTWVQTHLPPWYSELLTGRPDAVDFPDPVGPHPEQLRILTYLGVAAGHKGLGFWSDRFLDDPCHGKARMLELALVCTEVDMLREVLGAAENPAKWRGTSDPNVQAAVIAGANEVLVVPVWLGPGTQYTPANGALASLTVTVPAVPEGAEPWLISPAGVTKLRYARTAGGTQVTVPEFDTAAAVVFTGDVAGKVARWQDHTRYDKARAAAQWAQELAVEQLGKALAVHAKIVQAGGPELPNGEAAFLAAEAERGIRRAKGYADTNQFDLAYREARRALRPVRVLMRADWEKAVGTLDTPTASPYAVSFYSLPQHWQLHREVQRTQPGPTGLAHGGFELSRPAPAEGAAVSSLEVNPLVKWEATKLILDPGVDGLAAVVNSDGEVARAIPRPDGTRAPAKIQDPAPEPPAYGHNRYAPTRVAPRPPEARGPAAGHHCLLLRIDPKAEVGPTGRPVPPPLALERAVVSVHSPAAEFPPGALVRVSFWVKVPAPLGATADGLVAFDTAGGEPLGVRVLFTGGWRQFHLYRRVPADGKVGVQFSLTGLGVALIDDVKIEPLLPDGGYVGAAPAPPAYPLNPVRQAAAAVPAPPPQPPAPGGRR